MPDATQGALAGVRVLDLGTITAGAATTAVLADFGADVVKVESRARMDPFRGWNQVASASASAGFDHSPPFLTVNRGKREIGIDLKKPGARELFLRLVAVSDVVVENFRRGVLERLGIGYEDLHAANPRIVLLSLTSQGTSGPQSKHISFGSTLDALGGLMSLTGYDAETPTWSSNNVNYPDQLVSFFAPGVVLAALRRVDRTGRGTWIDFSQRESVISVLGESVVARSAGGPDPVPTGNRIDPDVLQGVYPATGDDQWVAVTVDSDERWTAVRRLIGGAVLDDVLTLRDALREQDAVDAAIAAWTAELPKQDAAALLRAAGAAASPVQDASEVLEDRQLRALGFFQPSPGEPEVLQRGFSARLSATPATVRSAAPRLGEHSVELLRELLGLRDDEIDALLDAGVVEVAA